MGQFLYYKIVDSKTVVSQVKELQVILHEMHAKGMMLSETFQVAAIIEKRSPTWKDFKNERNEVSIEDLIIRLRIEEDNRGSKKKVAHNPNEAKANFVYMVKVLSSRKITIKGNALSIKVYLGFLFIDFMLLLFCP